MVSGRLAATLVKSGRDLHLAPGLGEDAVLALALGLKALRARIGKRISLALIDGQPAAASPWAPVLAEAGFESDRGSLVLW